jgi:hypothetical protein
MSNNYKVVSHQSLVVSGIRNQL